MVRIRVQMKSNASVCAAKYGRLSYSVIFSYVLSPRLRLTDYHHSNAIIVVFYIACLFVFYLLHSLRNVLEKQPNSHFRMLLAKVFGSMKRYPDAVRELQVAISLATTEGGDSTEASRELEQLETLLRSEGMDSQLQEEEDDMMDGEVEEGDEDFVEDESYQGSLLRGARGMDESFVYEDDASGDVGAGYSMHMSGLLSDDSTA